MVKARIPQANPSSSLYENQSVLQIEMGAHGGVSPLYPPEDSYLSEWCPSQGQQTPLNRKFVVSSGYFMSLTNHTFHATLVTLTHTLPTSWGLAPSNHTIVSMHVYVCIYR